MRHLVVVRGAPGAGKTTFIEGQDLSPFAFSVRDMRRLFGGLVMNLDSQMQPDFSRETQLWENITSMLEMRMIDGQLIVVEGTLYYIEHLIALNALARKHRYRVTCVDFSQVPIERCLAFNRKRPSHDAVPESAIHNAYEKYATSYIPNSWNMIDFTHEEKIIKLLEPRIVNLNGFNKIHIFGDIHGCYKALKKGVGEQLNDDSFYIFLGDYIDRGPDSERVVEFLMANVMGRSNAVMLFGNHEEHIYHYVIGQYPRNRGFREVTLRKLLEAGINKRVMRDFCDQLLDMFLFTFGSHRYVANHGGLPGIPEFWSAVPSRQFYRGIGKRTAPIDELFSEAVIKRPGHVWYQLHGHRNCDDLPIRASSRSYNLEGRVEAGGALRKLTLTRSGAIGEFFEEA